MNRGKVETVLGPVECSSLGITLPHEHLSHECNNKMLKPSELPQRHSNLINTSFKTENLWWINYHPYSHVDNLVYTDTLTKDALKQEVQFFKQNGGGTIVDNNTLGRDLNFLKELSQLSGTKIVAGTGFYVGPGQPEANLALSEEKMYDLMKKELMEGKDGIKCGFIGEIGTSYPLLDFERRSLSASGQLQEELGVPAMIHPGRRVESPKESLRVLLEAGGKADRTVMAHLERTLVRDEDLLDFASSGTFCEFDLFGVEISYYELAYELEMPSDAVRIRRLKTLIDEGFLDRILISHDIHTKHRLMKFGGHGFSHIVNNVIPQMKRRGFTSEQIQKITQNNPQKWLTL